MNTNEVQTLILATALISILFSYLSSRSGSPLLAIANRWMRWFFIATLGGGIVFMAKWTLYPLEVLVAIAFLLWFIIETGYNWLAIHALSRSDFPLFPNFSENENANQWPSLNKYIRLREKLKREGFEKLQGLIATLEEEVLIQLVPFEEKKQWIRLQVMFFPNQRGYASVCFAIHSQTQSGKRLVTDNLFLPFGGFYPDNWQVERKPLCRSLDRLLSRHRERMDAIAEPFVAFEESPIDQINNDQRILEKLNRDLGFLNDRNFENETGKLSPAGRARIWQEIWTLAYLGKPLRYNSH